MKTEKNKQKLTERPKRRRMTFSFESPEAEAVILMGDFNHWNAKAHPMKKDKNGVWRKIVMVYPGRYEYKFLVDGYWQWPQTAVLSPGGSPEKWIILKV